MSGVVDGEAAAVADGAGEGVGVVAGEGSVGVTESAGVPVAVEGEGADGEAAIGDGLRSWTAPLTLVVAEPGAKRVLPRKMTVTEVVSPAVTWKVQLNRPWRLVTVLQDCALSRLPLVRTATAI